MISKYIIFIYLILLFLFPVLAYPAPVTVDATSGDSFGAPATADTFLSWSHTVSSDASIKHKRLYVIGAVKGTSATSIRSIVNITYNGDNLTKLVSRSGASNDYCNAIEIWYIDNPDTGTHTITITTSGDAGIVGAGISFLYTNPKYIPDTDAVVGTSSSQSTNVTLPFNNEILLGGVCISDPTSDISNASGQTTIFYGASDTKGGIAQPSNGIIYLRTGYEFISSKQSGNMTWSTSGSNEFVAVLTDVASTRRVIVTRRNDQPLRPVILQDRFTLTGYLHTLGIPYF